MSRYTFVRKFTLFPQGDKDEINKAYKYIRNGMEIQAAMMNMYMSALYSAKMHKADDKKIKELNKYYSHTPDSKLGSPYTDIPDIDEKYPTGLPIAGDIPHTCFSKFKKSMKDGLMYGNVSLPTYKKDAPLLVAKSYINIKGTVPRTGKNTKGYIQNGFYHNYKSYNELYEALTNKTDPEIYLDFTHNIVFKIQFGNIYKSRTLRDTIAKIYSNEYEIHNSSIGIKGKKIILNLTLSAEKKKPYLDENICVGVDRGLKIIATCALNTNTYLREYIGNYDNYIRVRQQTQAQTKRIRSNLKYCKGGHGRRDKLAHLERIKLHEREFVKTYNHMISYRVVKFALDNHAKYINMENLSGFKKDDPSDFVRRNWSYYELQQFIISKAEKYGIKVRFIEPAYTSQICSICGQKGIRKSQSQFECVNPKCKCHTMYNNKSGFNADFNAARNIAMSTHFVTENSKDISLIFNKDFNDKIITNVQYNHCYVNNNNIDILCEDGFWHTFERKTIKKLITDPKILDTKQKKAKSVVTTV